MRSNVFVFRHRLLPAVECNTTAADSMAPKKGGNHWLRHLGKEPEHRLQGRREQSVATLSTGSWEGVGHLEFHASLLLPTRKRALKRGMSPSTMPESAHLQLLPSELRVEIYHQLISQDLRNPQVYSASGHHLSDHRSADAWIGARALEEFWNEVVLPVSISHTLSRELKAETHKFECPRLVLHTYDLPLLDQYDRQNSFFPFPLVREIEIECYQSTHNDLNDLKRLSRDGTKLRGRFPCLHTLSISYHKGRMQLGNNVLETPASEREIKYAGQALHRLLELNVENLILIVGGNQAEQPARRAAVGDIDDLVRHMFCTPSDQVARSWGSKSALICGHAQEGVTLDNWR